MTTRPDEATIENDWTHLSKLWSDATEHWVTLDDYYWRTFEVFDKKLKRPSYHPAKPTGIVDHAVNTMLAYQPKATVFSVKPGVETHDTRADRKEKFLQAAFDEIALQNSYLVWKQFGKHLIHYGYAVIEGPVLDFSDMPTLPRDPTDEEREIYEAEKANWNPFRVYAPHPARVRLDPNEKQPHVAVKRYMQYAHVLESLTAKKRSQGKTQYEWQTRGDPYEQIEVTEWISDDWKALMAKGAGILYVEKNGTGFTPFSHAFAGSGMERTDEMRVNPKWWAKGILTPVLESMKVQAQQASARNNAVINRAYARLKSSDPEGTAEALAEDGVIPMSETEWLQYPAMTADVFSAAEDVDRDIEQNTYNRALAGESQPGVSTVGATAINTTNAMRQFEAPNKQMEEVASITGSRLLRLVDRAEELEGSLTLRGHKITKEDIDHNYACKVTFELVDPVIQNQMRELGMREVAAGLKSAETYRNADMRLEDETGERKRMAKERARQHPYYILSELKAAALEDGKKALADRYDEDLKVMRAQMLAGIDPGSGEAAAQNGMPGGDAGGIPMTPGGVPTSAPTPPGSPGAAGQMFNQIRKPLAQNVAKPKRRRR